MSPSTPAWWGYVALAMAAGLLSLAADCGTDDPVGADVSLQSRPDDWCAGPKQKVSTDGYCLCKEAGNRYDDGSGDCVACQASCTNRTCGDDGCQGSCGQCESGSLCANGACVACTPNCAGRGCGDDGCGGSCGSCTDGAACSEQGICEAGSPSDPNTITECNCNPTPFGASPGGHRYESRCASGFVRFELCSSTCGQGGQQWREVCSDGLPCGAIVQPCSCAPTSAMPGTIVPSPTCSTGFAQLLTCNFSCGYGVGWGAVCTCQ